MKFATTLLVASATAKTVVDPVTAITKCPITVSSDDKTANETASKDSTADWTAYLKNDPLTTDTASDLTALGACHTTNVKGKVTELDTNAKGGLCIVEFNKW